MATMTLPTPRYEIGQTVFSVSTDTVHDKWPCPDCNDTKKWAATSPAGEAFVIDCPRCAGGTLPRGVPSLGRVRSVAGPRRLTIGSVRIDTAARGEWSEPVEYMCVETGVGSGSVYRESSLHPTEDAARAAADIVNAQEQAKLDAMPQALRSTDYAKWTLRASLGRDWSDALWNSWYHAREFREAMQEVVDANAERRGHCDCDPITDLEGAQERLSDVLRERPWRDPHPVDALLAAAEAALPCVEGDAKSALEKALAAARYQPPVCATCESPRKAGAVDPQVDSTGKLSTRAE